MNKEKVFPLKISSTGFGALKEQAHKHVTGEQEKIRVTFGLDSELRIIEPVLYMDGMFIESSELANQKMLSFKDFLLECKREGIPIYYPLNKLTYVCVQNIIKERGKIVKNSIHLYVPMNLANSKLSCNDVSFAFPIQNRNTLANTYLEYALSRI